MWHLWWKNHRTKINIRRKKNVLAASHIKQAWRPEAYGTVNRYDIDAWLHLVLPKQRKMMLENMKHNFKSTMLSSDNMFASHRRHLSLIIAKLLQKPKPYKICPKLILDCTLTWSLQTTWPVSQWHLRQSCLRFVSRCPWSWGLRLVWKISMWSRTWHVNGKFKML